MTTSDADDVTIRPAASAADPPACQEAQRRSWGIADDSYVVPLATMAGAQHHGGLVLGAFLPDGSAVGLSFAFLGKVGGRPCLYSQLTGVVPGRQGQGLGRRLKEAQREFCRWQGVDRIAWSFDPLQSKNARFNINRLGATGTQYIADMYGRRTDALNAGAATDRLIVEWPVAAPAGERADLPPAGWADFPRLIAVRDRPDGAVAPAAVEPAPVDGPTPVLIQIPSTITTIRRDDPARAEAWTRAVRAAFGHALAAGRVVDGFFRDDAPASRRYFYILRDRAAPGGGRAD